MGAGARGTGLEIPDALLNGRLVKSGDAGILLSSCRKEYSKKHSAALFVRSEGEKYMNITVYLGANEGNDPILRDAVSALGRWIGSAGHALVYGGSKSGLMGALAESVLQAGGKVTGVEPQFFIDAGLEYNAITELIVTKDMAERKAKMIELGDAFIAFPGGTGTLEEISEVMSKVSLGHLDKPCILYNLNGYYDGLKTQLTQMIALGLSSNQRLRGICFAENLEDIRRMIPSDERHDSNHENKKTVYHFDNK